MKTLLSVTLVFFLSACVQESPQMQNRSDYEKAFDRCLSAINYHNRDSKVLDSCDKIAKEQTMLK